MLSYMVPIEEKPPPAPKGRLALELALRSSNSDVGGPRPRTAISKESSTSSFASDFTCSSSMTPTSALDKPKHKLLANGTKNTTLKRVSFGSSKGSMVETLIYESPLQEEPENSPPPRSQAPSFPYAPVEDDSERSKVRVSFYQGARPQCVSPPLPHEPSHALAAVLLAATTDMDMAADTLYNRQISTDSGWDNPFQPDGDLSREADEIVSLIKGGKPITPTPPIGMPQSVDTDDDNQEKRHANNLNASVPDPSPNKVASPALQSTPKVSANGTKNGAARAGEKRVGPGPVEVQRSPPQEPQQAEHVLIKKKPKCKCCVVQ